MIIFKMCIKNTNRNLYKGASSYIKVMTKMQKFLLVHDDGTTKTIKAKSMEEAWNESSVPTSELGLYTLTRKD